MHLRFGAENLGKTKAPTNESVGAFEDVAVATAVSFYSSRAFKGITTT